MEARLNLLCLLFLFFSLAFHRLSDAMTFTNESSSFIQLKNWNVSESRGLGFRFKTFMSEALLVYMDDKAKSNFLRVELFGGRLRLTCSHGSKFGAMAVEIGDNLNDLQWHRVLLERMKGETTILLDGRSKSTVNSRKSRRLSITSSMYFGGIPPKLEASRVTQPSVLLLNRFIGCIEDIEMFEYSAQQGKREKAIWEEQNAIAPGCKNMCEIDNKCQNNGNCLNRFGTSECDCTATGFRGKTCSEALPVLGLSLSDYVTYNRSNKVISSQQDRIILRFKTANPDSSILETGLGRDYLVIELYQGSLLVRWNLGSGELYLHVREQRCDDGEWHSVDVIRNRHRVDLTLDGVLRVNGIFPGRYISFNLRQGEGDVYIGGMVPSHALSSKSRSSGRSFDGCLQELFINGVDVVQGVVDKDGAFRTKGRPIPRCKSTRNLESTTAAFKSTVLVVTTAQTRTERLITSGTSSEKGPLPTLLTTSPRTNSEENKINFNRTPTIDARGILTNSLRPCVDDEDDCNLEDSGSGDGYSSGETPESSGDTETSSVNYKENNIKETKHITNKSVKKPWKPPPTKSETEVENEVELVGEPEISRENCIEDDEDGCNDDNDSGQSSAVEGSSAGSASPTPTVMLGNNSNNAAHEWAQFETNNTKKWRLIAGIIVVAFLLVAFSVFAIWWLYKHKNDPYWNGSYKDKGSKEKCLQSEVTDV